MECKYASLCSGCEWIKIPFSEQGTLKIESFKKMWIETDLPISDIESTEYIPTIEERSRDRVDLTIKTQNESLSIGLYDTSRSHIIDIESCSQMSVPLEKWYKEFRRTIPRLQVGSFRLRVSPSGKKGVWLDLPNITIKELLDEGKWFYELLKLADVEIGQKRKRLKHIEGKLKLTDAQPEPWFQTYIGEEMTPLEVYSSIGEFSQPGFATNKVLISKVMELVRLTKAKKWLELGSGSGNLTIPLACYCDTVDAVEMNESALQGLKIGLEKNKAQLQEKEIQINFHNLNFHKQSERLKNLVQDSEAVLVDPPRSGLGDALSVYNDLTATPRYFIYVSCFPQSFVSDSKKLYELGYQLKQLALVDQFPQSSHYEIAAAFERKC